MRASVVSRRYRVTRTSSALAAVDAAGKHFVTRPFVDRQRFAGDRRLVDRADARHHRAIDRNFFAGLDHDDGARRNSLDRELFARRQQSRTSASAGVRSISARTASRARSSVRASSVCAMANRKTTAAASFHWPSTIAPAAAISISTLMSSERRRSGLPGLASGQWNTGGDRAREERGRHDGWRVESARQQDRPRRTSPLRRAARFCVRLPDSPDAIGSSCSSHARIPASAIAPAIALAFSLAASYLTCSRWPIRSAEKSSMPWRFLKRRSISATSSRQSIPSIRNVDSACS